MKRLNFQSVASTALKSVTKPHAAMKRLNARMLKNGMKILSYKTARGYEALKQQYAGSRTVYLVTKPHAAMKRLNVSLISLFLTFPKGYKTARGYEALKRCEWCAENDATHCYKTARGYEALKHMNSANGLLPS